MMFKFGVSIGNFAIDIIIDTGLVGFGFKRTVWANQHSNGRDYEVRLGVLDIFINVGNIV